MDTMKLPLSIEKLNHKIKNRGTHMDIYITKTIMCIGIGGPNSLIPMTYILDLKMIHLKASVCGTMITISVWYHKYCTGIREGSSILETQSSIYPGMFG